MDGRARLRALDSLRGLAALSVLAYHSWPGFGDVAAWAQYPPFSDLWAGQQAVILFFVLSGFVLALPWLGGRPPSFRAFVVRRFFRLYPLYAVAVLGCALWAILLVGRPAVGGTLTTPSAVLREYLPMVGSYRFDAVDGPIWSLVHEARISLVFPLLMVAMARLPGRRWWIAGLLPLSIVAHPVAVVIGGRVVTLGFPQPLDSLEYLPMFVAGVYVAERRGELVRWYLRQNGRDRVLFAVANLLLYQLPEDPLKLTDLLRIVACCGLIVTAIAEPRVQPVLAWRPLVAIGAASYSLYLLHALVLYPANLLVPSWLPWPIVVVAVWSAVLPAAVAAHRWIERPAIAAGHRLTKPTSTKGSTGTVGSTLEPIAVATGDASS